MRQKWTDRQAFRKENAPRRTGAARTFVGKDNRLHSLSSSLLAMLLLLLLVACTPPLGSSFADEIDPEILQAISSDEPLPETEPTVTEAAPAASTPTATPESLPDSTASHTINLAGLLFMNENEQGSTLYTVNADNEPYLLFTMPREVGEVLDVAPERGEVLYRKAINENETELWFTTFDGQENHWVAGTGEQMVQLACWWPGQPERALYNYFPSIQDMGPWHGYLAATRVSTGEAVALPAEKITSTCTTLSPDGQRMVYVQDNQLWLHDFEAGGDPTPLSLHPLENIDTLPGLFSWSPDGQQIAFPLSIREGGNVTLAIALYSLETQSARLLHTYTEPGSHWHAEMRWSPDGQWLLLNMNEASSPASLWLVRPDSDEKHYLGGPFRASVWRPDSQGFLYHRDPGLTYYYDIETMQGTEVELPPYSRLLQWSATPTE